MSRTSGKNYISYGLARLTTCIERVMLNYAGNVCDTGDLVIGPQTSVGLSKWCLSWAGMLVQL